MSMRWQAAIVKPGFNPLAPHGDAYNLYAWGLNQYGQLGLGNLTKYSSPKQVGSLTNWSKVFAGQQATLAIKTDGTLWSWGNNSAGNLGLGNTTNYSSPKQVGSLTTWSIALVNMKSSFAIKSDGTLWSWGADGSFGALGQSTTYTNLSSPKQVGALTNWLSIAGSNYSTLAVKTNGTLWSWGLNQYGVLGLGNTTAYSSPKQVGALTNWRSISSGAYHVIATKTDGTMWAWGQGTSGELGLGNLTNYSSPKQIGSLTTWSANCNGGYQATYAVTTAGALWVCGNSGSGRLGLNNVTPYSSPKQVGALTNWNYALGYESGAAAALKTDGTLWGWGYNFDGNLGLGNVTYYSSPKQIGLLTTWQFVSTAIRNSNVFAITNTPY